MSNEAEGMQVANDALYCCSALTCIFSLMLILIIRDMGKWNDYINLIFYMAIANFMWAFLLFGANGPPTPANVILRSIIHSFSLLSHEVCILLSYTVFHVLYFKTAFNMDTWKYAIYACWSVLPIAVMIIAIIGASGGDYSVSVVGALLGSYSRIIMAIINVIFFFVNDYLVRIENDKTIQSAQRVLVDRMKWYQIMLALARLFPFSYHMKYGFNFGFYDMSKGQFYIALLSNTFGQLTVGLFLVIFLYAQPNAFSHLKATGISGLLCRQTKPLSSSEKNDNASANNQQQKQQHNDNIGDKSEEELVSIIVNGGSDSRRSETGVEAL